jgi:hypothetical protein
VTFSLITANAGPGQLVLGPDNQVYFTQTAINKLGQFLYF